MPESNVKQFDENQDKTLEQKAQEALAQLLLKQVRTITYANIGMLTVAAAVIFFFKEDSFVIQWLVLGYGLIGIRLVAIKKLHKSHFSTRQFDRLITFVLVLSGLHWGVLVFQYLDPNDTELYAFLAAVLLGIITSVMPGLAPRPRVWLMYSLSISVCVFAKFIWINEWLLAVMVIIGQMLVTVINRNLSRQIKHSVTQDLRNEELLKEVNLAKETAEKANLAKSKFMAAASHDLRQPLHVQSILLEMLNLRIKDEESKQLVDKIVMSNNALSSLFNALLEISQLDAGTLKVNISHQNLNEICQSLIEEYRVLAHQKNLMFKVDIEDSVVISDPILLKRILSNLLSNAIKFTETGSIAIEVNNKQDNVVIVITDTGIGIDPSLHDKIFEEYVQIGNQARDRSKGIGLGLSLVSRLSKLLNHKIKITSKLLKGTQITLTLAKGEASKILQVDTDINQNQIDNTQILLIDDEQDVIDAMTLILTSWGGIVEGVTSIKEALVLIANGTYCPDVIISDYRLNSEETGLDGLSLIQNKLGEKIPSLLITGDTDPKLLEEVNRQNLYILHKPVKTALLKKAINILLKQHAKNH